MSRTASWLEDKQRGTVSANRGFNDVPLNRVRLRPGHDLCCVLPLQNLHRGKLFVVLAVTIQLLFSWLSAQAAPKAGANAPVKLKLEETPLSRDIKAPISFAPVAKKVGP